MRVDSQAETLITGKKMSRSECRATPESDSRITINTKDDADMHESQAVYTLLKACRFLEDIVMVSDCFSVKENQVICKPCLSFLRSDTR